MVKQEVELGAEHRMHLRKVRERMQMTEVKRRQFCTSRDDGFPYKTARLTKRKDPPEVIQLAQLPRIIKSLDTTCNDIAEVRTATSLLLRLLELESPPTQQLIQSGRTISFYRIINIFNRYCYTFRESFEDNQCFRASTSK